MNDLRHISEGLSLAHSPVNSGGRLSKNAETASRWSLVRWASDCMEADISMIVSKLAVCDSRISFLVMRRTSGGCRQMRAATKLIAARHGVVAPALLLGLDAAAEDDLASRPSHHDLEPEHDHDDFESFVVLGFGGRGHDLLRSFDVHYLGSEQAQGVNAAKLELVPKSAKVRNTFDHILLWIDPARGVSVQQQFFEPSGDYRLAKYSNIQLNGKIPDSAFKLKTTGSTKVVSPQG